MQFLFSHSPSLSLSLSLSLSSLPLFHSLSLTSLSLTSLPLPLPLSHSLLLSLTLSLSSFSPSLTFFLLSLSLSFLLFTPPFSSPLRPPVLPSVVMCLPLMEPGNGQVVHQSLNYGSTATYNCNPGYTLEGEEMRVCLVNASWSGSEPSCQRKRSCMHNNNYVLSLLIVD